MRRYVLALDLVDDPALIAEYEEHHRSVPPAVEQQMRAAGVLGCQIFRLLNRLVMVLEVAEGFSFQAKAALDAAHEATQDWEALMWRYQRSLPCAKPGQKWIVMDKVYELGAGGGTDAAVQE